MSKIFVRKTVCLADKDMDRMTYYMTESGERSFSKAMRDLAYLGWSAWCANHKGVKN